LNELEPDGEICQAVFGPAQTLKKGEDAVCGCFMGIWLFPTRSQTREARPPTKPPVRKWLRHCGDPTKFEDLWGQEITFVVGRVYEKTMTGGHIVKITRPFAATRVDFHRLVALKLSKARLVEILAV
jgi:hypothetical protein